MKKNLLLSAIILQVLVASAQRYEWVSHSNQNVANFNAPVGVDPAGNVYTLIGTNASGGIIQGDTLPSLTGGDGVIIAKFSATGTFLWGSMVNPNNGIISGEKIAVDNAGAVYASINFPNGGSAHLADTVFTLAGGAAGVIIKLNTNGNFVRALSFTNIACPRISCLGTDLYISYANTIAKLDSALNTIWSISDASNALNFGPSGFSRTDLFVQANGELIASAYEGPNSTGPKPFGNDTVHFTTGGFDETAVIKMDTSGQVLWTKALLLSSGVPSVTAVCLDMSGNGYLGLSTIGNQIIFGNDTLVNIVGAQPYSAILKWDTSGAPLNGIGLYSFSSQPAIYDLAVNAQDELLVSGDAGSGNISINNDTIIPAYNNFYLYKFNSAGTFVWYKDASSVIFPGSLADGIAVRNGNEYFLAGSTVAATTYQFGCITFATTTATNFVTFISDLPELYPVASFTFSVSNDTTYNFTDASQNGTSWHWDFGDGDTSNLQNPSHDYTIGGNFTVILTTYHGVCSSSDTIQIIGVGIDEINSTESFLLSPNPATNELRIESSGLNIQSIDVYGLVGEKILHHSFKGENKAVLDVRALPPGIYFVSLRDEKNNLATRKIVKM